MPTHTYAHIKTSSMSWSHRSRRWWNWYLIALSRKRKLKLKKCSWNQLQLSETYALQASSTSLVKQSLSFCETSTCMTKLFEIWWKNIVPVHVRMFSLMPPAFWSWTTGLSEACQAHVCRLFSAGANCLTKTNYGRLWWNPRLQIPAYIPKSPVDVQHANCWKHSEQTASDPFAKKVPILSGSTSLN